MLAQRGEGAPGAARRVGQHTCVIEATGAPGIEGAACGDELAPVAVMPEDIIIRRGEVPMPLLGEERQPIGDRS